MYENVAEYESPGCGEVGVMETLMLLACEPLLVQSVIVPSWPRRAMAGTAISAHTITTAQAKRRAIVESRATEAARSTGRKTPE